jgi:hypothetical protein
VYLFLFLCTSLSFSLFPSTFIPLLSLSLCISLSLSFSACPSLSFHSRQLQIYFYSEFNFKPNLEAKQVGIFSNTNWFNFDSKQLSSSHAIILYQIDLEIFLFLSAT